MMRWLFSVAPLACVGSMMLVGVAASARAQEATKRDVPTITVQGAASVERTPDTAMVVFGVVTERPVAADAMNENSKAVASAIAALKADGIRPEDISTISARLTPETNDANKGVPKIVRYRAVNQLQVRLKPADRVGALLSKLVDLGVNDVDSISAVVGDDAALRDQLRGDATRNARHKAELYAAALDLKLGTVTRIDPDNIGVDAPFSMASMAKRAVASAPVPVEMGQQTLLEAVHVTFALEPR